MASRIAGCLGSLFHPLGKALFVLGLASGATAGTIGLCCTPLPPGAVAMSLEDLLAGGTLDAGPLRFRDFAHTEFSDRTRDLSGVDVFALEDGFLPGLQIRSNGAFGIFDASDQRRFTFVFRVSVLDPELVIAGARVGARVRSEGLGFHVAAAQLLYRPIGAPGEVELWGDGDVFETRFDDPSLPQPFPPQQALAGKLDMILAIAFAEGTVELEVQELRYAMVPEPGSGVLLAVGLALVVARARHRRT